MTPQPHNVPHAGARVYHFVTRRQDFFASAIRATRKSCFVPAWERELAQ